MRWLICAARRVKDGKKGKEETVEYSLGNETIIQPRHAGLKVLASKFTVMNIVVGAVIGAAIVWFLIVPAVNEAKADSVNKQIIEYSERINAMEAQISAQTKTLDEYREQRRELRAGCAECGQHTGEL